MQIIHQTRKFASDCYQSVCKNKKNVAGVGVVLLAGAACFNKLQMNYMQQSMKTVAKDLVFVNYAGRTVHPIFTINMLYKNLLNEYVCPSYADDFTLQITFEKAVPVNRTEVFTKIEELYNNATSNGLNILSPYSFVAILEQDSNGDGHALFKICRLNWLNEIRLLTTHLYAPFDTTLINIHRAE